MQVSDIWRRLLIAAAVGAGVAIAVPVTIATFGFGPAGVAAGKSFISALEIDLITYCIVHRFGSSGLAIHRLWGPCSAGSVFAILQSLGATAGAAQLGVGLGGLAAFGVIVGDSA
ncbi:hypothetical protein RhiXN_12008 [Rhizoctonia solani]|uniref:Uncharacterized protein n=1 Tax=Rhizoctonia solani TaxID=456999 RepID=A0A8H8P8N5_9AGAM|nr:uncharacterized protein RhiXN_12008 [Rhizoctonia solani]QRW26347.1 hypothetical protein RhiXN_12008 [Rhizoctonia solani]